MIKDLFPLSIAKGSAFCNRHKEQEFLIDCINKSSHVVLIAPRRYGKSSLSRKVASRWANSGQKKVAVQASMLSAWNVNIVAEKIIDAVSQAFSEIRPSLNSEDLKTFAASLNRIGFTLEVGIEGFKIGLSGLRENPTVTLTCISKILTQLDQDAGKYGWKVTLELDEFQEISRLPENHAIEAEIREAIQSSSNISCIFLGSNRQMLESMFIDKSRPFYKMCHLIRIQRIESVHYHSHIEDASNAKWGKRITTPDIDLILNVTERHPYYINKLCSELWRMDTIPAEATIQQCWSTIVQEEETDIVTDITNLSLGQKAVMRALALKPENKLGSKLFIDRVGLASSTIRTALKQLQKDDMIYQDDNKFWKIMNPCLAKYLR